MAGRGGPGPSMLKSGKLPKLPENAKPVGTLSHESEYYQKDRHLLMDTVAASYAKHGLQTKAYQEAGISYDTFHRWLKTDPYFQTKMREAQQMRRDVNEKMIHDRLERPEGNRGSDVLLIFKSKGEWPEKYGDRIQVEDTRLDSLLERLAEHRLLVAREKARSDGLDGEPFIEGEVVEDGSNASDT